MDQFIKKCELSSPPNMDSKEAQKLSKALRITPYTLFTFQEFVEFLTQFSKYIVCREYAEHEHFHVLLEDDITKTSLRKLFKDKWPLLEGNGMISIKPTRDYIAYKTYILKEHEWVGKGYDQEELKVLEKTSYKKYSKESFAKELQLLDNEFITGKSNKYVYIDDYIRLKVSYNQHPNEKWCMDHLEMLKCKQNHDYVVMLRNMWINSRDRKNDFNPNYS